MKRLHRVFVSYHFQKHDGNTGFGYIILSLPTWRNCLSVKDIEKMNQYIKDKNDFETVVILNYQIM